MNSIAGKRICILLVSEWGLADERGSGEISGKSIGKSKFVVATRNL